MVRGRILAELGCIDSSKPFLLRLPHRGIERFSGQSLKTSAVADGLLDQPSELRYARLYGCAAHPPGNLSRLRRHLLNYPVQNPSASSTGGVGGPLAEFAENHVQIPAAAERMTKQFKSFP